MPKKLRFTLSSYEDFKSSELVVPLVSRYKKDSIIAAYAVAVLKNDLEDINTQYNDRNGRVLFTNTDPRVKSENSFFRKLYRICCAKGKNRGVSPSNLKKFYAEVKDLAGVRFACPYYRNMGKKTPKFIREDELPLDFL